MYTFSSLGLLKSLLKVQGPSGASSQARQVRQLSPVQGEQTRGVRAFS